jgi:hypothetical protein
MKITSIRKIIHVPAAKAWEIVSMLTGLENYLSLVSNSGVVVHDGPTVRSVTLNDGSVFNETILEIDHKAMRMTYDIQDPSPFPYSNYTGWIRIQPICAVTCELEWTCIYKPEKAQAGEINDFLESVFNSGIDGLENYCNSANYATNAQ